MTSPIPPSSRHRPPGSASTSGAGTGADAPLHEVTFVVVDLETSGGAPGATGITEIGAVKVCGGEVLGQFATLVDPECAIPPQIERLTRITTLMVHDAPRIASVLPAFLEFLGPHDVLVAHNAAFDTGYLRAAASALGIDWPHHDVVDTLKLARALVSRDEVRNHRLGTLATVFASSTTPNHRALADALATVDVLHGLISRAGSLGVTTRGELLTFRARVPAARRRRARLADDLPAGPGLYVLHDHDGSPLYVATADDIRRRVRSLFTTPQPGRDAALMIDLTAAIRPRICATALESQVLCRRLIAEDPPRFNRAAIRAPKPGWLTLTDEPTARLGVTREPHSHESRSIGPFDSSRAASAARDCVEVLSHALATQKGTDENSAIIDVFTQLTTDVRPALSLLESSLAELMARECFEEARGLRAARLELLHGLDRHHRGAAIGTDPQLIAARVLGPGAWEFVLIRSGRFIASAINPPGTNPQPVINALGATHGSAPSAPPSPGETDAVLRWLESPGIRLVESGRGWAWPLGSAAPALVRLAPDARGHPS